MLSILTRSIRKILIGEKQDFTFYSMKGNEIELGELNKTDLYIHIPFCKSMCPYCPYNRIRYERNKVKPYLDAILKEIVLYGEKLGKINIGSIYIGGGTPTNLIDELAIILESINEAFNVKGNISIETSVYDINETNVRKLKEMGVSQISIGVQSFDDRFLKLLGRNYKAEDIVPAIKTVKTGGFKSINIDLMFALPGQKIEDIWNDLKKAIELNIDQITAYPLFTFPYSTVGKYRRIKQLKMPNLMIRRKMYYTIYDYLESRGYNRVSVWGFKKGASPEYSSVTREKYLGFGAGAATYTNNLFYFNTFSVEQYCKTLSEEKSPISVSMKVGEKLSNYYWLYWRLYEGEFSTADFKRKFSRDKKVQTVLKVMHISGLIEKKNEIFSLTRRGAFWIHLAQNHFMLDYINKVWTVSMNEPWPKKIEI